MDLFFLTKLFINPVIHNITSYICSANKQKDVIIIRNEVK